jgi:hypothetical protein
LSNNSKALQKKTPTKLTRKVTIVGRNETVGPGREKVAREEHGAAKQAETQNDLVLAEELGVLRERAIDDVCEVGLKTKEHKKSVKKHSSQSAKQT